MDIPSSEWSCALDQVSDQWNTTRARVCDYTNRLWRALVIIFYLFGFKTQKVMNNLQSTLFEPLGILKKLLSRAASSHYFITRFFLS